MKLVPMRFNGFSWHHNPKEITFECDKAITELKAPYGSSYIQDMGRKNMVVRGVGELYGTDCIEQFNKLLSLFRESKEGILSIPKITTIFAIFESIKIVGDPTPDMLIYSFVFREVMERKKDEKQSICIAHEGETLWDISHKYGVVIDTLVKLNPQVKRPDIALDGKEVRLC